MNEKLHNFLNHRATLPTSTFILGTAVGVGGLYILQKIQLKRQGEVLYTVGNTVGYVNIKETDLGLEIDGVVPKTEEVEVDQKFTVPNVIDEAMYNEVVDIIRGENYEDQSDPQPEELLEVAESVPTTVNVFKSQESDDIWDQEAELSTRTANNPYVIHVDEFQADEMGYEQVTLTYYEGDDILTDVSDIPIHNYKKLVGELTFGHGSKSKNLVYVRNEGFKAEYEIIRDPGYYMVEVLGQQIEAEYEADDIRHSKHATFRIRPTD